ncbi:DNA repair protein RecN [Crocinitomicaceae bacterium]|nr:DNA repair protein RecN [Crocinitomicaceae bacterium]MDC0100535.1 DNA repair protein RecN [Crocinitomicaceae bacterium]MDC1282668.1 DNA repair protein RecN [Crocinitomicaceae bacterium]MDC1384583.1 DNA repair protein RecN [Crocinitomicaceae bacterium]
MIKSLRIENFALIDSVNIQFDGGFTVITGETGSGKSILLNALNLILGERANFSVIGELKDKSVVEAEIDISGFNMKNFFKANQLDYFDLTIVRREIYKQGRSRAFINDIPVQLNILKELTGGLIHIHSQYNTLELKDKDFQIRLLDVLAGTLKKRTQFQNVFAGYQLKKKELTERLLLLAESSSKIDYDSFQLIELQALDLDNIDYEAMKQELSKFENADELLASFGALLNLLEMDGGVLQQLGQVNTTLEKNASIDPVLSDLQKRVASVLIELKDISSEAEEQSGSISIDPKQLVELSSKLDSFNKATFKHRVQNQEELLHLMEDLNGSSDDLAQLEGDIARLTNEIQLEEAKLIELGEVLHNERKKSIPEIETRITKSLNELKLVNTILEFRLSKELKLTKFGTSNLEIYFSPNIGLPPVPIHQAASGGELSRVMLALQSLMSRKIQLQTILFDEIDTGVSGDVAQKIGQTLKSMGAGMQVIAITHLPQVAAKGEQHLSVSKAIIDGRTQSSVIELDMAARIEETARLMSGDEINEAALANAKALMS